LVGTKATSGLEMEVGTEVDVSEVGTSLPPIPSTEQTLGRV